MYAIRSYYETDKSIIDTMSHNTNKVLTDETLYQKKIELYGDEISLPEFKKRLIDLEKAGIIEKTLSSVNDIPYVTWRLNTTQKYFRNNFV